MVGGGRGVGLEFVVEVRYPYFVEIIFRRNVMNSVQNNILSPHLVRPAYFVASRDYF